MTALEHNLAVSVEKAKMEACAGMHEQLLKRYQDGLRDGAHLTQNCHIFKKDRERHPDATRRRNQKDIGGDGGDGPGRYLSSGRVVAQPGDGSCLFHSLCYGLGDGTSARCDAPRCWPLSDVHCKGAEARDS